MFYSKRIEYILIVLQKSLNSVYIGCTAKKIKMYIGCTTKKKCTMETSKLAIDAMKRNK